MEGKFKSHMVDVRGLSRKEAKEKRKRAYREFMLYRDLKEAYHAIQERTNANVRFIRHERTLRKI